MMPVAIVTGSQTCIPKEVVERYDIVVLPYGLNIDNRTYRDGIDISPEEFYSLLPNMDNLVHTSAVTPGVFTDAYNRISSQVDGILVITIASGMSTAYNNALIATDGFENVPVRVLDSRTAAMAQGFVAIEAAKTAKDGGSLDQCYKVAEEAAERVELFAYICTFEYLKRSGHVNAVKALAANALSIKPVFRFKEGDAVLAAKKRSTVKAREFIAEQVERFYREKGAIKLSVFHAAAADEADDLLEKIRERIDLDNEVLFTEFTPVMGCHTGPGVVGAAFL
jgi:DegV family protein with EDD domain